MKKFDLTGQRFGSLEVITYISRKMDSKCKNRHWLCRCDCGRLLIVRQDNLKDGRTTRCGDCRMGGVPSVFIEDVIENGVI